MPAASNVAQVWELHKSNILHLYFAEGMTLGKLVGHMKQEYGFDASKGQYESQFQKWNLRKNLKSSEWKYISHRVQKRKREGKESAVYFNRVAIAPEKVKKEISRHAVPTYLSAPTPKTPNDVSVCMPAPSPDESHGISENGSLSPSNTLTIDQLSGFESLATCLKLHVLSNWFVEFAQPAKSRYYISSSSIASLFEMCDGDFRVIIGILLEADLQDKLFGSNKEPMLLLAAERGRLDQVVMVAQGGKLLTTSNMAGAVRPRFQLMLAAYHGSTHGLSAFLALEEGRHLIRTRCGAIALHIAVECSQIDIVAGLLAAGVHIDAHDDIGDTPLHRAIFKEDEAMMLYLLNHGHPVDAKSINPSITTLVGDTPLHRATENGHLDCVKLLLDAGADPSPVSERGWTPLHWAAENGRLDCVKLLLDAGAYHSPVSASGRTPLYWAAENGHLNCVKLLLDVGADPSLVSNAVLETVRMIRIA